MNKCKYPCVFQSKSFVIGEALITLPASEETDLYREAELLAEVPKKKYTIFLLLMSSYNFVTLELKFCVMQKKINVI
jgi:hypothetical protein